MPSITKRCSIQECERPYYCGNFCNYHYQRNRLYGSPTSMKNNRHNNPHIKKELEYGSWSGMKARCNNPNSPRYKDYGGRGIRVCERWLQYSNFVKDMGRRPSIEYTLNRIDNDGDYTPENCEWATQADQNRNRRSCRFITINGVTKTITDWSKEAGISFSAMQGRINAGWPTEKLLLPKGSRHAPVSDGWLTGSPLAIEGITQTVTQWAKQHNLQTGTLKRRLRAEWPADMLFVAPQRSNKKIGRKLQV